MAAELARLFLAAPLTEHARQAISRLLRSRIPRGIPGRPVRPENWHLTLRFLGQVDPVGRDRVLAEVDRAPLPPPFSVRWAGLGAFPRPQRATVLWLGMDRGAEESARLADRVEEAVEAAGFAAEERPFKAHLTLSRIRPHQDVSALLEHVAPLEVSMPVDRVVLYESHLGRGGARYEAVEEFPLA